MLTVPISPSNLFPHDLFERFNRLESVWHEICRYRGSSKALQHQLRDMSAIDNAFDEIRKKLLRERFSVGFLGTSQAGKSTTLNNYIDQRKLLPEGEIRSCTSIRVRFHATSPEQGYYIKFVYLTKDGFRERRDDLACGNLNLFDREGDQQYSDEAVLEKLDLAEVPQDEKHFETLLRRLLEAAHVHRSLLSESSTPHVVQHSPAPANDSEVKALLQQSATHGGAGDLRYALLDEIQLGVPGLALPNKLELVDLPGLGTARAADSEYTMRAVQELDAAIVAINFGGNLDVPENYVLVKELRKIFGGDARRVWIVGTKMDSVGPDLLWGNDGKNFPRMLAGVLKQHNLHSEHVSFVANTWYKQDQPTASYIRLNHQIEFDAQQLPVLPGTFDDHPEFRQAFSRFCEDGGIQALKDVINGTMVDAITEGLSRQIDRGLGNLTLQLSSAVRKAQQSANLGASGRALARRWRFAIDQVTHSLNQEARVRDDENPLRKMASEVRRGMRERLQDTLRYARPDETGPALAERFQDVADEMQLVANQGFGAASELTQQYFANVVARLEKSGGDTAVPPGVDPPIEKLQSLLRTGFSDDRQSRLMQDIHSLKSPVLIDGQGGLPFGLTDFRQIMLKKIDQVVRQVEYRFQNFVRMQLQMIADELRALTPPEETTEQVQESVFDQLLSRLDSVAGTSPLANAAVAETPSAVAETPTSPAQPVEPPSVPASASMPASNPAPNLNPAAVDSPQRAVQPPEQQAVPPPAARPASNPVTNKPVTSNVPPVPASSTSNSPPASVSPRTDPAANDDEDDDEY